VGREVRARSDYRSSRRRPEWHRNLLAGGRSVRLRHPVDTPADVPADGCHSGHQRQDWSGQRPRTGDQYPTPLSGVAALRHGHSPARGEYDQYCSRSLSHGRSCQPGRWRTDASLHGRPRSVLARFAGFRSVSTLCPHPQMADACPVRLRRRRVRRPDSMDDRRGTAATSRPSSRYSVRQSARTCFSGRPRRKSRSYGHDMGSVRSSMRRLKARQI
jgi:hypothetical protein